MKIVVFSDGTGNSSAKLFRTNVWRLYEALDLCDNTRQVAFYDNGVGTASFLPLALLGGAFGYGLKRNVRDIYSFICRNARQGEHQIYAFGFSRGAFTIRVLLGLIQHQGLVPYNDDDRELTRLATWAYREYRREALPGGYIVKTGRWIRDSVLRLFDKRRYTSTHNRRDVRVAFVGLWDTVAAYGFPIVEMTRGWDRWVWPLSLPTRDLVAQVDKACHALALDDERQTFHPLLWNESNESRVWRGAPADSPRATGEIARERVSQVWFSGMHSNVGGGYPDDGMAYEPLCWIAEHAVADGKGIILKDDILDEWRARCTASSPMSDSRSGLGAYYRYLPRLVSALADDDIQKVWISRPKIHASVLRRIRSGVSGYAPIVLPPNYSITDGRAIVDPPAAAVDPKLDVIETPEQARDRFELQEQVWDAVWYRRIAYFLTVAVTVATLSLALLPESVNSHILPWAFPTVSGIIGLLGSMLPSIAAPLLDHFKTYPSQLVVGGLAVLLLMRFSSWVEQRNGDTMRRIWDGKLPPEPSPFLKFARSVRKAKWYVTALDRLRYRIAPNFFGVSMLLLIVFAAIVLTIRLSFDVPMILGQVCKDARTAREVGDGTIELPAFDLTSPCYPTGVNLKAGTTYVISVDPGMSKVGDLEKHQALPWRDGTRPVPTVKGFQPEGLSDWRFWLAVPVRRHKVMDWYVPVARVGSYADHYFQITDWKTEITPQSDGQLFLYVNDALLIYPMTNYFYSNNNTCTNEAEATASAFATCQKPPRERWFITRKDQ